MPNQSLLTTALGTASDILSKLSALDGVEVELTIELATRQRITNDRDDETVISYEERTETVRGVLRNARPAGHSVHVQVGSRLVIIRGTNPICAPQLYSVRGVE